MSDGSGGSFFLIRRFIDIFRFCGRSSGIRARKLRTSESQGMICLRMALQPAQRFLLVPCTGLSYLKLSRHSAGKVESSFAKLGHNRLQLQSKVMPARRSAAQRALPNPIARRSAALPPLPALAPRYR